VTREENIHEVDLMELFEIIWGKKLTIFLCVILSALFSYTYAKSQVNYFQSDALLKIVSNSNTPVVSSSSGYASMLGVNIGGLSADLSSELIATIKSKDFFKILLQNNDYILQNISAAKNFDLDSNLIIYNENIYNAQTNIWVDKRKPSFLYTYNRYKRMLAVGISKDTGFLNISVEHVSPIFAKELIDIIVSESNSFFRRNQFEESSRSLEYLTQKLETEPLVSIRSSIQQLVTKSLEKQMMANINEDFILSFIDNSYVYENKSRPNKPLICILGTLIGFLASILFVLLRHYILKSKKIKQPS
jgi:LPS O-antigen subunit length determinant protein (WzzB/FepE family)